MIKEISNLFLSGDKRRILRAFDIILWISLLFVTFNKWVFEISPIPLKEIDQIYEYILSASYINFIQWTIIIILIYILLKFLLIRLLPYSDWIYNLFLKKSLKPVILVPILDIQFKKGKARREYKEKAKKFIKTFSKKKNIKIVKNSKLIIDILLKIFVLGLIQLGSSDVNILWLKLISIIFSIIAIGVIEVAIISAKTQNRLHLFISKVI